MGEALLGGLLANAWAQPSEVAIVERLAGRREELNDLFPGVAVVDEIGPCTSALIAVKPDDVSSAAASLGALEEAPRRVLSIAAGVTIATLEQAIGRAETAVIRAMPNTPALVGRGAAAIAPGAAAGEEDLAWAEEVLGSVGVVTRVKEELLDAVTGLSGSGPAYVFLVAESLVEAGVLNGLPRDVSTTLTVQTLLGAATLLADSGRDASALRADVTSPGGTTAAGLWALESAGVRAAFLEAVSAATRRSRELG